MAKKRAGIDYRFLVIGDRAWGKSTTEDGAKKVCKSNIGSRTLKTYLVYLVPPDARVTDMGDIVWADAEDEIILLKKVKDGKEVEITAED